MLNSIFDELKEVKYSTRNNRFQESFNVKCFKEKKKKTFEESSTKSSATFRTQASIYDGSFLWIYLTAYYFRNKSSIIDDQLGYMQTFENIEIFKVRLSGSKSSRLLQRVAFLVCFVFNFAYMSWLFKFLRTTSTSYRRMILCLIYFFYRYFKVLAMLFFLLFWEPFLSVFLLKLPETITCLTSGRITLSLTKIVIMLIDSTN